MKRTRTNKTAQQKGDLVLMQKAQDIAILSESIGRLNLSERLGKSYGGERDVYDALGYPKTLNFIDYYTKYKRQDIAKAVIDRPVQASWKGDLQIIDDISANQTGFEKDWGALYTDLGLKNIFMRVDRLASIGRYGVLMLGLNDVKTEDGFAKPVKRSKRLKLAYVKPLSEASAKVESFETNKTNKRYGLPKYYNVTFDMTTTDGVNSAGTSLKVHHSRIIHITEDILENEVYGTPKLEAFYNRLVDLEKLVGGSAEMYWRGARPGYVGKVDPDYQMGKQEREDLKSQIEEFEHNLKRVLVNEGVDYHSLAQQIADPSAHVDVQIQLISAVTGIPKRILTGSERGELSSAQDKQEYISYTTGRREEVNEPYILRPFIKELIDLGILSTPKSGKYNVVWDKLFSLSDQEKIEVGKQRAISLREYSTNPAAQYLLPYESFLSYLMAFDDVQIEKIKSARKESGQKELSLEEIAALVNLGKRATDSDSKTTRKNDEDEGTSNGDVNANKRRRTKFNKEVELV